VNALIVFLLGFFVLKPSVSEADDGGLAVGELGLPRGIRNNNPGNIEDNGTAWKGYNGNDGRYVIFDHHEYGIRAMNRILNTYASKYGLRTIRGIIHRWAPPVENITSSYVNAVSQRVGVGPDVELSGQHRADLIAAIIHHENGQQPYTVEAIARGMALA
jgi:hypothetical protein